jgi:hypothetical protein
MKTEKGMEGPILFWGYKEQESHLILPEHDYDDEEDLIMINYAVNTSGYIAGFRYKTVTVYARIKVSTNCFKIKSLNFDHIIKYILMSSVILKITIIFLGDFKEFDVQMQSHYVSCQLGPKFINIL